ncbi:hypothetical protein HCJ05_06985 [Listeria seeligeri]|uniref:hypothetical protein n=1 Tax=Listeria seeligeri TaxID=1640 RepID=UPI0016277854|nr:hypothetical protein [Listeria seeligeri]MBC1527254.1 hypothetical protein [Listeria seeligeri]MBC1942648.1 hypothetical protein [Listeria seeligeri]
MNRKRELIIGSIILVCIVVFFIVGKSTTTSYEELEKELTSSIETKNTAEFLSLFDNSKTNSEYASIGAKSILENWDSELDSNTALIMEILDPKGTYYAEFSADDKYNISIKQNKHWLFFNNYYLDTNVGKINLDKSAKSETIYLEGKKIASSQFEEPFFPGVYEFSASKKFEYATIKDIQNINVNGSGEDEELTFTFEGTTVNIPKGPESLFVTFNGKATEMHLKPTKEQEFGPIAEDDIEKVAISGELPLVLEVGNIKIEDNILFINDGTEFENTKFDNQKLSDEMNDFIKSEFTAFKSRKISDIKNVTDNFISDNKETYTQDGMFIEPEHRENTLKSVYYDKETPKLFINDDGELQMEIEGIILSTNEDEELVENLTLEFLYVEKENKWLVNEYSCINRFDDLPSENAMDSYIVTKY